MANDSKIQDVALNYIRKHVEGGRSKWLSTTIGSPHPSLVGHLLFEEGELVLVSGFFTEKSWYAFTTRRIVSQYLGVQKSINPAHGIVDDFGNFKGYVLSRGDDAGPAGVVRREIASITACDTQEVIKFEFETWEASMLPIYAARYWDVKHAVIDKLMKTAERENYKIQKG